MLVLLHVEAEHHPVLVLALLVSAVDVSRTAQQRLGRPLPMAFDVVELFSRQDARFLKWEFFAQSLLSFIK